MMWYTMTSAPCMGLLLVSLLVLPHPGQPATVCQPIDIDMCKSMPYNTTAMPNLLRHSTQENARLALEPYRELVEAGCSDDLVFFLCSVFTPICSAPFRQQAIPPCREVCTRVKARCEPLMLRYNVRWPRQLDCRQFPLFERSVCLSPEAIIAGPMNGEPNRPVTSSSLTTKIVIDNLPKDCPCDNTAGNIQKKAYYAANFHYAIKATFISAQGIVGGPLIITIYVSQVLKTTRIQIPSDTNLTLWADRDCICPNLQGGKDYLILGFEHPYHSRLLFDDSCRALPWKKKWMHRIKTWEQRRRKSKKKQRTTTSPTTTTTTTAIVTTTTKPRKAPPAVNSGRRKRPRQRTSAEKTRRKNRRKNKKKNGDDRGNVRIRHEGGTLKRNAKKQESPGRIRNLERRPRRPRT